MIDAPTKTQPHAVDRTALQVGLGHGKEGNVAIIFALLLMPMVFAAGMGIDYTAAVSREDALNAIADAAALAAVRPALLAQSDRASINAATTTFNA